ncbi:MAG: glycosyltransferase family 39 protein [Phycisphaerae bacterium]|nr:glycosyltransferase family 39 protein [Phycisphaerae bacterium]
MSTPPPLAPTAPSRTDIRDARVRPWSGAWGWTLTLVLGLMVLRIVYLWIWCPYTLIEDEAHYWEWSRRLDWAYYSKGPGIAWLIALGTRALGDSEAAIRTFAPIASALAALAVARLAREAFEDPRVGFYAALAFQLAPINQAGALLATIDGPYLACWAAGAWAAWRALGRGSWWAWPALGAAVGCGFLFKSTILFLPIGVALAGCCIGRARRTHPRWRSALASGVVLMVALGSPVVTWNAAHGWPQARHLIGHVAVGWGDMPVPPETASGRRREIPMAETLEFLLGQLGLMGPILVIAAIEAWACLGPRRRANEGGGDGAGAFMVAVAAPILLFYLGMTTFNDVEGNWPLAGYATLLALAARGVVRGMDDYRARVARWRALPTGRRPWEGFVRRKPETVRQVVWHLAVGAGLVTGAAMLRADLVARLFVPDPERTAVGRVLGARKMGAHVQRLLQDARRGDPAGEPFLMAEHYGRASLMAYYVSERPVVRCASVPLGGRMTQYDIWPETRPDDPSLHGRAAVLLGGSQRKWRPLFERVEDAGKLEGEHKEDRRVFIGHGYLGVGAGSGAASERGAPR